MPQWNFGTTVRNGHWSSAQDIGVLALPKRFLFGSNVGLATAGRAENTRLPHGRRQITGHSDVAHPS